MTDFSPVNSSCLLLFILKLEHVILRGYVKINCVYLYSVTSSLFLVQPSHRHRESSPRRLSAMCSVASCSH